MVYVTRYRTRNAVPKVNWRVLSARTRDFVLRAGARRVRLELSGCFSICSCNSVARGHQKSLRVIHLACWMPAAEDDCNMNQFRGTTVKRNAAVNSIQREVNHWVFDRFSHSFTCTISSTFVIRWLLKILPHVQRSRCTVLCVVVKY